MFLIATYKRAGQARIPEIWNKIDPIDLRERGQKEIASDGYHPEVHIIKEMFV